MFNQVFTRTILFCVLAITSTGHAIFAQEPDSFNTRTTDRNAPIAQRQFWNVILRTGYSTALRNSFHPVDKGSFTVSSGIYLRPWDLVSFGAEIGYQRWRNDIDATDSRISRGSPDSFWNIAGVFSLHTSSLFRLRQVDPFFMFTFGLYDRHFESGSNQWGPGFAYGVGINYMPNKLRFETDNRLGFGIIIRQHTVLLDDYGAWFVGPSHYWTKTFETAAEIKVSW
jgi:hypothetical protein